MIPGNAVVTRGTGMVSIRLEELILEEFKKFAMRGNVIDLAVGIIMSRPSRPS